MLPGSARCQTPAQPSATSNTFLPSPASLRAGSPQVILMLVLALPFTSTLTQTEASLAALSQDSIWYGHGAPSMVVKRRAAPLSLALAKSKLAALRLMPTGNLATSPITPAPVGVVSRVMTLDLAPMETEPPAPPDPPPVPPPAPPLPPLAPPEPPVLPPVPAPP